MDGAATLGLFTADYSRDLLSTAARHLPNRYGYTCAISDGYGGAVEAWRRYVHSENGRVYDLPAPIDLKDRTSEAELLSR